MSPRVDPANTLPVQKSHKSDPVDRMIAEALDNLLLDHARSDTAFTIISLRDLLLQQSEFEGMDQTTLRYRVRDRLSSLENHGLLEQVGLQGKCRKVFRLNIDNVPEDPPTTEDNRAFEEAASSCTAEPPHIARQSSPVPHTTYTSPETPPTSPTDQPATTDSELHAHLDLERHALRTEMETVMGESEHLRQLLVQFPQESDRINPLLDAAIAQGSQLKGKLDANIKLRRTLADEDRGEGEA
ncbi:hypothetical protein GCM10022228_13540 [Halomonas cibimaris]|uniref:Helix-turn-helix domain-containing protein n=1 Tax=Halomonas cibimaris TaxID=657012 RepID=A0ABP7LNM9_9GAMM